MYKWSLQIQFIIKFIDPGSEREKVNFPVSTENELMIGVLLVYTIIEQSRH